MAMMQPIATPSRVGRAIRDAHDEAERTIGWFQMGVVVFGGRTDTRLPHVQRWSGRG